MAVLLGWVTAGPEQPGYGSGSVNAHLSHGLNAFEFLQWPTRQSIITHLPATYAVSSALPVASANAHVIPGSILTSYFDDFYNRIHITPPKLTLGNVAAGAHITIDVWNAYFDPVTLTDITGGDDSVTLDGPQDFPETFNALQLNEYTLIIEPGGASVLDLEYDWIFTEVPALPLSVDGTRVIAWTITPNWSSEVKERIEWRTDILTSTTGAEQRRALRIAPRKFLRARALAARSERALLDNMLHGWGANVWSVPMWHEVQRLAAGVAAGATVVPVSTLYRDFAPGGFLFLRSESAHVAEVASIDSVTATEVTLTRALTRTWPAGSRVYPARPARLVSTPTIKRLHDQAWEIDFELRLDDPVDYTAHSFAVTYRSHPLYELAPDETEELSVDFERLLDEFDSGTARAHITDTAGEPFPLQLHRWVMHGVAEREHLRQLWYALRGRQVSMWVPTFAEDFVVTQPIFSADVTLTVENTGFALFGVGRVGRRDIRIELTDGTRFYRRVDGATFVDDDTETLDIDAPLGQDVAVAEIRRISFMRLMRADDDSLEILHETDIEGSARAALMLRAVRDEL